MGFREERTECAVLDLFGSNATCLDVPFLMYRHRRWTIARPGRPDLAGDFNPMDCLWLRADRS